jgi:hypothetical protein
MRKLVEVHVPEHRRLPLVVCLLWAFGWSAPALDHTAALAVDRDGNAYVATGHGEAGVEIRKWDKDGRPVDDPNVPLDDGIPSAICVDEEYLYCAVSGWARGPWNNRQQIRRFRLKDGKPAPFTGKSPGPSTVAPEPERHPPRAGKGPGDTLLNGHIQVYEWPELLIPKNATDADRRLMRRPLRALDVAGSTLYVADALGGVVRMYDTDTGAAKGTFGARLPRALAVDPVGHVWVADNEGTVRAYRTDGYSGVTYSGLGDITAMSFGPGAKLFIADARAGQVFTLNDSPDRAGDFTPGLGPKSSSGGRGAVSLNGLTGVAADAGGNLVTLQQAHGTASTRLARWSPDGKLLWERFAARFVCRIGEYRVCDVDLQVLNASPARP